jgi:hypothetical protein
MGESAMLKKTKDKMLKEHKPRIEQAQSTVTIGNQEILRAIEASRRITPNAGINKELPEQMKARMEAHFGFDLSNVSFKESPEVSAMGAKAFAQGNVIKFAPGQFNPDTMTGKEMIGHELAHIVQQAKGGVNANIEGSAINFDDGLEHSADVEGARAAMAVENSYSVSPAGSVASLAPLPVVSAEAAPIQGLFGIDSIKKWWRNRKEKKAKEKHEKELSAMAKGNARAYSSEDVEQILSKFSQDKEQSQYQQEVLGGDFRNFAHMSPTLKHALASQFISGEGTVGGQNLSQMLGDLGGDISADDVAQLLISREQALNPMMRKAISMLSRSGGNNPDAAVFGGRNAQFFQQLSDSLDTKVMENTLKPISWLQEANALHYFASGENKRRNDIEMEKHSFLKPRVGWNHEPENLEQAISQNTNASLAMMKIFLAMQLGDFKYKTKDESGKEIEKEWDRNMAVAYGRGARTGFVMPSVKDGENSESIFDSIFGANREEAGMYQRTAATHGLELADADKPGTKGYKEKHGKLTGIGSFFSGLKRKWGFGKNDTKHYGMDLAIGGMGNSGIGGEGGEGQLIMKDGRSGHLYVGTKGGNKKKKGGMLVSLESDAPYRMNQTGHIHDMFATGEEASSTGGYKTDLVGKKYGGRTVDLSGFDNESLISVMNAFTEFAKKKMTSEDTAERDSLTPIIKKLVGKRMSEGELLEFLQGDWDMLSPIALDIIKKGRKRDVSSFRWI